jgi:hypothetical protein
MQEKFNNGKLIIFLSEFRRFLKYFTSNGFIEKDLANDLEFLIEDFLIEQRNNCLEKLQYKNILEFEENESDGFDGENTIY